MRGTGALHPTRSIPESDAPASVEDCDKVGEGNPAHPEDRALLVFGRRRKSAPDGLVRLWFSPRRKPKSLRRNRSLPPTFGIREAVRLPTPSAFRMETDPRLYCVTRSLWQRMRTISTLTCRQARSRNSVEAHFILCTKPPCGWPVWEWASVDRRRKRAISCRFFFPMEPGLGAILSQEPIFICIWLQGAVGHRCVCG